MLVFSRSADWCPYCRMQIIELQRSREDVQRSGYELAVVTYDSRDTLKRFADRAEGRASPDYRRRGAFTGGRPP